MQTFFDILIWSPFTIQQSLFNGEFLTNLGRLVQISLNWPNMWMITDLIASNSSGFHQVGIGGMTVHAYPTWVFSE